MEQDTEGVWEGEVQDHLKLHERGQRIAGVNKLHVLTSYCIIGTVEKLLQVPNPAFWGVLTSHEACPQ